MGSGVTPYVTPLCCWTCCGCSLRKLDGCFCWRTVLTPPALTVPEDSAERVRCYITSSLCFCLFCFADEYVLRIFLFGFCKLLYIPCWYYLETKVGIVNLLDFLNVSRKKKGCGQNPWKQLCPFRGQGGVVTGGELPSMQSGTGRLWLDDFWSGELNTVCRRKTDVRGWASHHSLWQRAKRNKPTNLLGRTLRSFTEEHLGAGASGTKLVDCLCRPCGVVQLFFS